MALAFQQWYFGLKLLASLLLIFCRIELCKSYMSVLKHDLQRVHHDPHIDEVPKSANPTIISVKEKVVQELRLVQNKVREDARADVAIEYCIKMILSNQLNEQDFDFHN